MTKSIAHRGDWTKHPENTLEAFVEAAQNGADMLELDVKLTKDGYAVLVHDETLTRIWGDSRRVKDLTWDEIHRIEVNGYRIPSFEEVIRSVHIPYMVDFVDLETSDVIADVLSRQEDLDRFLVVTGNIPAIARVKERLPEVTTGLTWDKPGLPTEELLKDLGVSYFNPYFRLLRPSIVEYMHERNIHVSCWTVDTAAEMRQLVGMGVDAIVSNKLQTLVNVLQTS
jgi:glycerophosphoryl diester phosphodiesterase